MFVGTPSGSGVLPTITGTPIHNGRLASAPDAPNGIAAKIDMQWGIDLGALVAELLGGDDALGLADLFEGVVWPMPDVEFVASNTKLQSIPDDETTLDVDESTTVPVRIPLTLEGLDNHQDPGDMISASYNPFQKTGVVLSDNGAAIGADPADRLSMLFDTGASLSIISTDMAADLGLDLSSPEYMVEVQGAAGSVGAPLPGFTLDSLELPVDNDGNGVAEGKVLLTNVPVFVFDVIPAEGDPEGGLDGILGMNLFNTAREMIYDPFDPWGASLSLTFLEDPYYEEFDDGLWADLYWLLGENNVSLPQSAGSLGIPGLRRGTAAVPEPSTLALLAIGAVLLGFWRLRRRRVE